VRRRDLIVMTAACLAGQWHAPAGAIETRQLRDPFAASRVSASAIEAGKPDAAGTPAPWRLNAVVLAGPNSLARVDGKIVALGEMLDGATLVAVEEGRAIFMRNRQRIVIEMEKAKK
jgi:hypothetical protein